MGIVEVIGAALRFLVLIFGEIFESKKRAREKEEKFELDQKKFLELAEAVILKMKRDAMKDSDDAKDIDDHIDEELKKKQ